MEKYYYSYDLSYEKFTPEWFNKDNQKCIDEFLFENTESMLLYLESYFKQFNISDELLAGKDILVTGCGFGGLCHFFAKKKMNVTGVDVSALAIAGAREIAKNKGLVIDYYTQDLSQIDFIISDKRYDFVVDDHLLHCLTESVDRANYLQFVQKSLGETGIFLLETMTFHSRMQIPVGYFFDENNILWQQIDNQEDQEDIMKDIMIRKISSSLDIENEIIAAGFKINYLYYHAELAFQVFAQHKDYPFHYLPRALRIAASLK